MKTSELKELIERATPGPWKNDVWRYPGSDEYKIVQREDAVVTGKDFLIATMNSDNNQGQNPFTIDWATANTNAALIALAPDLAAEVIRLREREKVLVDALRGMVASYGFQFHTGSVALRNARAALTDTEG